MIPPGNRFFFPALLVLGIDVFPPIVTEKGAGAKDCEVDVRP